MKASRALYDVFGLFTAKNTASVTPLISRFAGMDCGSFFFFFTGILAHERAATPMICSSDAFKGLKKPFFGGGGGGGCLSGTEVVSLFSSSLYRTKKEKVLRTKRPRASGLFSGEPWSPWKPA